VNSDTRTNDVEGTGIAAGAGSSVRMGADADGTIRQMFALMQEDQRHRHERQRTIDERDSQLLNRLRGLEWRVGALFIAFVVGAIAIILLIVTTIWLVIDRYMALTVLQWLAMWAIGCGGAVAFAWRVGHP
jgi:hypothetical protein